MPSSDRYPFKNKWTSLKAQMATFPIISPGGFWSSLLTNLFGCYFFFFLAFFLSFPNNNLKCSGSTVYLFVWVRAALRGFFLFFLTVESLTCWMFKHSLPLCHIGLSDAACHSKGLSASSKETISCVVSLEVGQHQTLSRLQRPHTQNWPNKQRQRYKKKAWNICGSVYAPRACNIILHTWLHFNWTQLNTSRLPILIGTSLPMRIYTNIQWANRVAVGQGVKLNIRIRGQKNPTWSQRLCPWRGWWNQMDCFECFRNCC